MLSEPLRTQILQLHSTTTAVAGEGLGEDGEEVVVVVLVLVVGRGGERVML